MGIVGLGWEEYLERETSVCFLFLHSYLSYCSKVSLGIRLLVYYIILLPSIKQAFSDMLLILR